MTRLELHFWGAACSLLFLLILSPFVTALVVNTNVGVRIISHVTASFGPSLKDINVTGDAAVSPTNLCDGVSLEDFTDKIVLVRRGDCNFYDKAMAAQNSNARAVVVGNSNNELLRMGLPSGSEVDDVKIPTIMIRNSSYFYILDLIQNIPKPAAMDAPSLSVTLSSPAPAAKKILTPTEAMRAQRSRRDKLAALIDASVDRITPLPASVFASLPGAAALSAAFGLAPELDESAAAAAAGNDNAVDNGWGMTVQAPGDEYLLGLEVSRVGEVKTQNWAVPDALVYVMLAIPIAFCLFFVCGMTRRLCRRRILREQAIDVSNALPLAVFVPAGARLLVSDSLVKGGPARVTRDTLLVSGGSLVRTLRSEVVSSEQAPEVGVRAEAAARAGGAFPTSGGFVLGGEEHVVENKLPEATNEAGKRASSRSVSEDVQMSQLRTDARSSSSSYLGSPNASANAGGQGAGERDAQAREVVLYAVTVARGEPTCGDDLGSTPSAAASPSAAGAAAGAGGSDALRSPRNEAIPLSRPRTHQRIHGDSCSICIEDYVAGARIKPLPCGHAFHDACINNWLARITGESVRCPTCNVDILPGLEQRRWESASCGTKFYRIFCGCEPCTRRVRAQSPGDRERQIEERHGFEGY